MLEISRAPPVKSIGAHAPTLQSEGTFALNGTSKHHPYHKIYPYLLSVVAMGRAIQVWALDTTYIQMAQGFVYLTAMVDVAIRKPRQGDHGARFRTLRFAGNRVHRSGQISGGTSIDHAITKLVADLTYPNMPPFFHGTAPEVQAYRLTSCPS